MRQKYNFKSALKAGKVSKLLTGMINTAIENSAAKQKQAALSEISIDVSKLSGIRAAALVTQSKLIVEEAEAPAPPEILPKAEPASNAGLSEAEAGFLRLFLSGQAYHDFLRERGIMLSIIIDSINEKLFDHFGDTVLVENGGEAEAIEDYLTELKDFV
jgi:hypothetical protein